MRQTVDCTGEIHNFLLVQYFKIICVLLFTLRRRPTTPGPRRQCVQHFGGRPVLPVAGKPITGAPVALHGQRAFLVHLVQHSAPHWRPLSPAVINAHGPLRWRPLSLPSKCVIYSNKFMNCNIKNLSRNCLKNNHIFFYFAFTLPSWNR